MKLRNCSVYNIRLSDIFSSNVISNLADAFMGYDSDLNKAIMEFDPYGLVSVKYSNTYADYLLRTPSKTKEGALAKFTEYLLELHESLGISTLYVNNKLSNVKIHKEDTTVWNPRF